MSNTIWNSSDPVLLGDKRLLALGESFWSLRVAVEREWCWSKVAGFLSVELLKEHLFAAAPPVDFRLWLPAPSLKTVLVVSGTRSSRTTLASLHPFASLEMASLHEKCFISDQKCHTDLRVLKIIADSLQVKPPVMSTSLSSKSLAWSLRDSAYFLSSASFLHAKCSLAVAGSHLLPVEVAGIFLKEAGFLSLSLQAAEIAVSLSENWIGSLPELISTASLLS